MTVVEQDGGSPQGLPPEAKAQLSNADLVRKVVDARICTLQYGYRQDRSDAVSTVARVRRGSGKPAWVMPDLWGLIGTEALYERPWRESDAEQAENAVHMAVTLWALHQQGRRDGDMHIAGGYGFGKAVRLLKPDIDEPIRKRFVRAATASSLDALAGRVRELVLLMRKEGVGLDYGLLAAQLYRWQRPGGRAEVHREWGRSFHSYKVPSPGEESPQKT